MFIFTKFVALTFVFCVGIAVLMDLGLLLTVRFGGIIVGIALTRWSWLLLWGLVWLGSFLLAWHVLIAPILARAPKG
jgi:hypothetical protein